VKGLIIIVVLLVLLWVVMIRPQRRRQVQQAQTLANLAVGDEILTAGGLYGRVEEVGEEEVTVEIAPGTSVRVAKRAVAAIVSEDEAEDEEEPGESAENPTEAETEPS
jgi:preprotein translocase subunit YajC